MGTAKKRLTASWLRSWSLRSRVSVNCTNATPAAKTTSTSSLWMSLPAPTVSNANATV